RAESPQAPLSNAALRLQTILLEEVVQRRAADAEELGGAGDVVIRPAQRVADRLAVGDLAGRAEVDELGLYRSIRPEVEVGRSDAAPVRHDDCALDAVLELADIAGPGIGIDRGQRIR